MKTLVSKKRSGVPHSTRPEIHFSLCHVVLRIRRGLPWLRTPKTYRILERAFRAGKKKQGFRLVHYSVQQDHLHLLVEADDKQRLSRGMQGLAIRIAKALNRFWRGRLGSVFAERYFARAVRTAKEIKCALAYVLNNARKHGVWSSPHQPDPFSSGRWFRRWKNSDDQNICRPLRSPPVEESRTTDILHLRSFLDLHVTFVPGRRIYDLDAAS
jgi:REP element-mobilizing transposase RayT